MVTTGRRQLDKLYVFQLPQRVSQRLGIPSWAGGPASRVRHAEADPQPAMLVRLAAVAHACPPTSSDAAAGRAARRLAAVLPSASTV
jgi:hypothetical protein